MMGQRVHGKINAPPPNCISRFATARYQPVVEVSTVPISISPSHQNHLFDSHRCRTCQQVKNVQEFEHNRRVCRACRGVDKAARREVLAECRNPPLRRICRRCLQDKAISEFYGNRSYADGYDTMCKACWATKTAQHAKTPEGRASARRAKERYRNTTHGKRANTDYWLRTNYGISLNRYEQFSEAQGGVCALCQQSEQGNKRLAVDHDHVTGVVRGLLCLRCNTAIERIENDPDFVVKVVGYLNLETRDYS